ncbi:hypothetical protein FEM48_Zijuj10G0161900 [Ziziphus jujuba var. spinosa]|uniref:Uncharacterized protein n=1 Tax=Ziziphus jujuba var. spinosa TaxID=714518 RepID=A0A978UPD8_ZIZJJ|nr:hypothetical protein FEM48_Zijuj10G0161900 [Ziziphus jujuba var. spinosa]
MVPQAVPPPPPSSSISFPTFVSALGIAILIFLINEAKFSELGIVLIIPVAILFLYMVASILISLIHRAVSVISSWLPFGIIQNEAMKEQAGGAPMAVPFVWRILKMVIRVVF